VNRPDYCMIPDEGQPGWEGPCPGCGATVEGKDPVRGVCQARYNGPRPEPLIRVVLIDKRTGEIV
jgi:hypothetical protein